MANKTITQLDTITPSSADEIPIWDISEGKTGKATIADIAPVIATGTISNGNSMPISGGTVYSALNNIEDISLTPNESYVSINYMVCKKIGKLVFVNIGFTILQTLTSTETIISGFPVPINNELPIVGQGASGSSVCNFVMRPTGTLRSHYSLPVGTVTFFSCCYLTY